MQQHFIKLVNLFFIFGIVLLVSLWQEDMVVTNGLDLTTDIHSGEVSTGFSGQIVVRLNSTASEIPEEYQNKINIWKEINEDVEGWIDIPGFNISYPVLYSTDNKMYLRTNIYGEYDISGSIYLDANYGNIYSPVKLIHGHNMRNGTMFNNIPQLLRLDTLDGAPDIFYCDDLGLKRFQIFSVFSIDSTKESIIVDEFTSIEDLLEIKEGFAERTCVPVSEIPNGIELLMLNTCWYGDSGREHNLHCIVVASRVD